MNKKTLMIIAALTLGGAATAQAATPAAAPAAAAKPAKAQTAHRAPRTGCPSRRCSQEGAEEELSRPPFHLRGASALCAPRNHS